MKIIKKNGNEHKLKFDYKLKSIIKLIIILIILIYYKFIYL